MFCNINIDAAVDGFLSRATERDEINGRIIAQLKQFRQIGDKFNYLSLEMIVTGHYQWETLHDVGFIQRRKKPCLIANYVDKGGRIRRITFNVDDLPALQKENPSSAVEEIPQFEGTNEQLDKITI